MNTIPDKQLIAGLIEGNDFAYHYLYTHYYKELCLFALRFLNNIDEAEEVVQELIFNLWKTRNLLTKVLKLKPYLLQSVKNRCFNYLKQQKMRNTHEGVIYLKLKEIELEDQNEYLYSELEKEVIKAMDSLPEQCQKVFKLSRIENLKNSEIAEKLDITVKAVEANITRALKILRDKIDLYNAILILFFIHKFLK